MRGVNGPAALKLLSFSGRCNQGAYQVWELERKGMVAVSENRRCRNCIATIIQRAELFPTGVRPKFLGKKRVEAPRKRCGIRTPAPIQGLQK